MTDPDLRPRRGAHRAPRRSVDKVPALIGALVILAVAVGLVWTLGRDDDSPTATRGAAPTVPPPSVATPTAEASTPPAPPTPTAPTDTPPAAGTGGDAAARDRFEVVVLNQTQRAGLAATVAETLRGDGWDVASIGNFSGTVQETTVYFPAGGEAAATELAGRLPVPAQVRPVFPALDAERLTVILTDNFP